MRKTEDKEKASTVETNKVKKEESLKVAGGRCWKRVWMKVLKKTGDHLHFLVHFRAKYVSLFMIGHTYTTIHYISLRDLGPAHHHPSSHCGLLSRRHYLLQLQLILFRLSMYIRLHMKILEICTSECGDDAAAE